MWIDILGVSGADVTSGVLHGAAGKVNGVRTGAEQLADGTFGVQHGKAIAEGGLGQRERERESTERQRIS